MASSFKVPIAVQLLHRVDAGELRLRTPDLVEISLTQVCTPIGDPYPERWFPWL
jgi:hypothetical protein